MASTQMFPQATEKKVCPGSVFAGTIHPRVRDRTTNDNIADRACPLDNGKHHVRLSMTLATSKNFHSNFSTPSWFRHISRLWPLSDGSIDERSKSSILCPSPVRSSSTARHRFAQSSAWSWEHTSLVVLCSMSSTRRNAHAAASLQSTSISSTAAGFVSAALPGMLSSVPSPSKKFQPCMRCLSTC